MVLVLRSNVWDSRIIYTTIGALENESGRRIFPPGTEIPYGLLDLSPRKYSPSIPNPVVVEVNEIPDLDA